MSLSDNRRYPRIPHVSSRQIIHLDLLQTPHRNLILTEDLSASGVKFTTNNRLDLSQYFLIYLNDQLMHEINSLYRERAHWVRAGDYYLTKVVWAKEIGDTDGFYEVGAAFVEKEGCRVEDIATFTELMNVSMLEKLPQRLNVN